MASYKYYAAAGGFCVLIGTAVLITVLVMSGSRSNDFHHEAMLAGFKFEFFQETEKVAEKADRYTVSSKNVGFRIRAPSPDEPLLLTMDVFMNSQLMPCNDTERKLRDQNLGECKALSEHYSDLGRTTSGDMEKIKYEHNMPFKLVTLIKATLMGGFRNWRYEQRLTTYVYNMEAQQIISELDRMLDQRSMRDFDPELRRIGLVGLTRTDGSLCNETLLAMIHPDLIYRYGSMDLVDILWSISSKGLVFEHSHRCASLAGEQESELNSSSTSSLFVQRHPYYVLFDSSASSDASGSFGVKIYQSGEPKLQRTHLSMTGGEFTQELDLAGKSTSTRHTLRVMWDNHSYIQLTLDKVKGSFFGKYTVEAGPSGQNPEQLVKISDDRGRQSNQKAKHLLLEVIAHLTNQQLPSRDTNYLGELQAQMFHR